MKRNDKILVGCLFLVAAITALFYMLSPLDKNAKVVVTMDGQVYGTYLLGEDRKIELNGKNTLQIQDGQVKMTKADCKDQICVHHRAISKEGEGIICLPNKLIVTVEHAESKLLDAVSD